MSQWGKSKDIAGVTVVPCVETIVWEPAGQDSRIEFIVCVDCADGVDRERIMKELSQRFVGRPYSEWLAYVEAAPDSLQ